MRVRKPLGACLALLLVALIAPAAAGADFGIESMSAEALKKNGSTELQAGAHPYEFKVAFEMNQDGEEFVEGTLRELTFDLPPGMVGNPFAVPRCTGADFEGFLPHCPGNTQVGVATIDAVGFFPPFHEPIYNLTPPNGAPASFGLSIANNNSFQEGSLRSDDYGVRVSDITIPTGVELRSIVAQFWGVPPAAAHDPDRFCAEENAQGEKIRTQGCESDAAEVPFLSLPTRCDAPLEWTLSVSSVQEPEAFVKESVESLGPGDLPAALNGCEKPPFDPAATLRPETAVSDSPTGLDVKIQIPQHNAPQPPDTQATAHLKDTVVTLPQGLAINPSAADGRAGCPLTGPEGINLPGSGEPDQSEPAKCPDASKVGTVEVISPLVDHPLAGNVYLAKQGANPFNSLIALYIAVNDPLTGVVVKLAGKVEPDPLTGQLTTRFEDNPQLPFEEFRFDFAGGPRAPLTTPPTCGTYTTTAELTPWTFPEGPKALKSDSFAISSAPGGGPCASSEAGMPHAPSFKASTEDPLAGAYSPFALELTRNNGSQRISALNTTLPPGVTANFNGVAECSEAQIAAAAARSGPGQGALEKQSPSCPAASQIGTVNVGAGSGNPIFVQGSVYLAGPYKGAPFSLAIITPGVAGPFDIGTVVVRAALYVNEETGQGTVKSDPLPTILAGIPLDVRQITAKIDRAGYVLNPTSCEEKTVSAEAISTTGALAQLKNRFQVGGCGALGYTPKLSLSMKGAVRRSGHPAFKAVLTQPSGQANSRRTVVILPPTTFIDQNHIANPCTRPQFQEGKCPPASVLGTARVFTPLFENPLEGPVYFRANGGERDLPDVVVDLNGRVHVIAVGFVDAVTKKGSESSRVRTRFANLPDAPITKAVFSFKGGKKGVFVNSANLCKVPNLATVKMSAHNGKTEETNKRIATSCKKK